MIENLKELSSESKYICGINDRFENESTEIQELRVAYAQLANILLVKQKEAGHSDAGRNYSIAITDLENSCMRTIKAIYS